MRVTGLIPARFLTLTSHLVLLVTILMAREENVLACLPVEYTSSEYSKRDGEFLGGLVAGIALTALELIGFISGVSMFASLPSIISITCHSGASISLAYLVLDTWDCRLYWWVFGLTSVLPALVEVGVMINVLMLKKNRRSCVQDLPRFCLLAQTWRFVQSGRAIVQRRHFTSQVSEVQRLTNHQGKVERTRMDEEAGHGLSFSPPPLPLIPLSPPLLSLSRQLAGGREKGRGGGDAKRRAKGLSVSQGYPLVLGPLNFKNRCGRRCDPGPGTSTQR
ncbi:hypothetical protein O3P69_006376 [Scylla paramamosain]|uniref:Transmembrane protein 107 n=1 Tax=Scylla paramamosain TaxID=85552 RepID=A0AAW0U243_SCYPA